MLEAIVVCILAVTVLRVVLDTLEGWSQFKHYVKTFSLRDEWEAFKTVKFYKEN